MEKVRILIADDHELVRKGLIGVLERTHPEWEIVAEASDGRMAAEMAETLQPNVAILDLSMPELNGLQLTQQLVATIPGIKILMLTIHSAEPVMKQIRQAGGSALLAKNEAPRRLVDVLEKVLAGAPFLASESASRPASQLEDRERVPVQYLLTPRELEVLRQLALGSSNKEVAGTLEMSVRTVETHRARIMDRLGIVSLGDMIKFAIHDGLV